jgi:3-oxoacyl-[acyl-carrier-protein] synthase II
VELKRVVITGIGIVSPLGNDTQSTWKALLSGKKGADAITYFDTSELQTKIACELKNFNPLPILDRKEVNKLDLVSQYALVSVHEALKQSTILDSTISKDRIGVIWATGNGGATTYDTTLADFYSNKQKKVSPYFVPKVLLDTSSGIISIKHGLKGVNYTTVSACASGTNAMVDAFNYIRWGKADAFVTGGSDAPICPSLIAGFNSLKALSTKNESPQKASAPFDQNRDGFVMGEGAAAFVIESLDSALARRAHIIAEIVGGGLNADAYHMTAGHPDGDGALACMQLALEEAGINANQLDYLNAHATSTPVGDLAESKAISRLLKAEGNKTFIGATKGMTGHLMGAAGAIEGAFCALALEQGELPPNVNLQELDPLIDPNLNLIGNKSIKGDFNYALSNNFGFGGHNSCIIFKKYTN